MKDKSIWSDSVTKNKYRTLKENISCDVLIIGGGITGFSTAYFLQNTDKKIVLVDGYKICHGTTAKSTGKLTYLQEDLLEKIKNIYDEDTSLKYLSSQKEAIRLAKKIILENDLKCNLESVNSYIFTDSISGKKKIKNTYQIIKDNSNAKLKDSLPIKISCKKSLETNDTFVFNPVKFVYGIADVIKDRIEIYENTRVMNIEKKGDYLIAHTKNGNISAKKIVLACHYPFFLIPYFFPFKTSIEKSFLVASEIKQAKDFSAINVDKDVLSIRYYKDKKKYIILASESASLVNNVNDLQKRDEAIWKMRSKLSPDIKYAWSNHDIMTSDHMPFVGKIKDNLFMATGYNTWGMTNGILAGKIISDLLLERDNPYAKLFDPLRNEKNVPKIIGFNLENGYSFIDTKINRKRNFYRDDVKIVKEDGIYYGIYIDENKKEHKVFNKCPHMKCSLSFNYQTKTWDCPCHGSSFDIDGNVIFGPSTHDIKIKKTN